MFRTAWYSNRRISGTIFGMKINIFQKFRKNWKEKSGKFGKIFLEKLEKKKNFPKIVTEENTMGKKWSIRNEVKHNNSSEKILCKYFRYMCCTIRILRCDMFRRETDGCDIML